MKAIFSGGIEIGFSLELVVEDVKAAEAVKQQMACGNLAEAVSILDPSQISVRSVNDKATPGGEYFVSFGKCLGGGFKLYGPFGEYDEAEQFGEKYRDEDDEYEVCAINGAGIG